VSYTVAIIPFRAGSRGVKHKNTRHVAGKPLWCWSLESARAATKVDRILVTTDIAQSVLYQTPAGYETDGYKYEYIRRPPELATDIANLDGALIHAIDTRVLPDDTVLVILQPTVPVRSPTLIDDCLRMFEAFLSCKSLLTANPLHYVWHGDSGRLVNPPRVNRQDITGAQRHYHEDGSVFIVRAGDLRKERSRVVEPVALFETERTVDIDTEDDLRLAEYLLSGA